jgi:hypothetical protein
VTCLSVGQASAGNLAAGLAGYWPLDDGSGDIARNEVMFGDGVFKGATGIITNAETGGAHPTQGDGLANVWVPASDARAADHPLGARTVWSTGGQGCRPSAQAPCVDTRNADTNPDGLTSRDTAFIAAGRIPKMDLVNEFSWAFWAKTDEHIGNRPGSFAGIVGNRYPDQDDIPGRDDPTPRQIIKFTPESFEYHYDGSPALLYNTDALGDPTDLNNIETNVWHHHAVVKNGTSLIYYRDGVVYNRGEIDVEFDSDIPFWLGGDDAFDDAEQWHGYLSDVAIWHRRLGASEIQAIIGGANIIPEPSTVTLGLLGLLVGVGQLRRKQQ